MKIELPQQVLDRYSNIKFHENPSIGSRVDIRREADTTKLMVAFHSYANARKDDGTAVEHVSHS
jgi:hypothetical protein